MGTQARKSLYLPLLIGGIAALMAWHPASTGNSGDTVVLRDSTGLSAKAVVLTAYTAPRQAKARANGRCAECGVVVSMEGTKGYGDDFGIDAAGGGDGDQEARRLNLMTRYKIIVRMADGSHSAINQMSPASWRLGERVIVIAGTIPPHR